jgi:pimeloyl-ACP methyl ester carboxylesterase
MCFFCGVLIIIATLAGLYFYSKLKYAPTTRQDETHFITTSDGWRLALHRYRARGKKPHCEPVLLHHGLTCSHIGFDLNVGDEKHPVPSLAIWLAAKGYDVWSCDLRGRGASEHAGHFQKKNWDWNVDDYIERDDPAIVDYILSKSPYKNLHWIGHSMGGILLFCYCALNGSPKIASGISAGSGLDYTDTGSHYQPLIPFAGLAGKIGRIPAGFFTKVIAPFCGRINNVFESFNYYPKNTAPKAARMIHGAALFDTTGKVFHQMAGLFTLGGLRSADGRTIYTELAGNVTTPMLLLAGDKDIQASPQLSEKTRKLFPGDDHQTAFFGKDFGHAEHYGHFDLLCGLRAKAEVYPHIIKWLEAHPAKKARAKKKQ